MLPVARLAGMALAVALCSPPWLSSRQSSLRPREHDDLKRKEALNRVPQTVAEEVCEGTRG